MANEIEEYLLEKFKNGIDDKVALHSQFEELTLLLDRNIKLGSSHGNSTDRSSQDASVLHNLYYLNNILTECQKTSKRQYLTKWSIKRSLNKIKEELWDINHKQESSNRGGPKESNQRSIQNRTQHAGDNTGSSSGKSQSFRRSTPDADQGPIHGFDDDLENLEKSLAVPDVQFKAIGIMGMAGIGKTALCQQLFVREKVRSHFVPRIWVPVWRRPSEDQSTIKVAILKSILLQLGVEEEVINDDCTLGGVGRLLSLLHQNLWGKRYLIVFDDVREDEDLEWYGNLETCLDHQTKWEDKLAHGLPKGHGGTVIVTTRSEEVAKKMVGPENLHRQMPIKEDKNCWSIFKDAAGPDGSTPEQPDEMLKAIVKGVPLAAKMMGQIVNKFHKDQLQNENSNSQ